MAFAPAFCCRRLALCGTSGKSTPNASQIGPSPCHKVEKNVSAALSKGTPGWYIPPAPDGLCPGVAFQGSLRDGRSKPREQRRPSIHRPRHFDEGAQRFNAGWSSPVARQAHNLKVIGSNPIPATKFGMTGSDTKMARLMRAIFVLGGVVRAWYGDPPGHSGIAKKGARDCGTLSDIALEFEMSASARKDTRLSPCHRNARKTCRRRRSIFMKRAIQ